MEKLSTMLWFDSEAERAAEHYVRAVSGSKIVDVQRYGKQGPGVEDTAMLVNIELAGRPMMLLNGGPLFTPNESVSFALYCDDQKEGDFLWAHMGEGGKFSQCGWLKDRWGFSWQIIPRRFSELMRTSPADAKGRVFGAMMQMQKFDIAKLEAAAKG